MQYIQSIIETGYFVTIPVIILLLFIAKQKKAFVLDWLYCSNLIIWLFTIFQLGCFVYSLIAIFYAQYFHQGEFVRVAWGFSITESFHFWFGLVLQVIVIFIFSAGKMRRSVRATTLIWVLLIVHSFFLQFVLIVTSLNRDYLPSSWSTYYRGSELIIRLFSPIIFNLMVLIVYSIRKKLVDKRRQHYFN